MKEWYVDKAFKSEALGLIEIMDGIIVDYVEQGYRLTARQLYYQLVARDHIPNEEKSYKRITGLINDAKLAGLLDWDAIEDRTREFASRTRWRSPREIMDGVVNGYHMDMWDNQPNRVYAIVEKEALAGVLIPTCERFDVPLLAARGYPSGTVLREFCVEQVIPALDAGQTITILHLGDHDPSGIDMTRDLRERIELFVGTDEALVNVQRIALTIEQVREFNPPPNPAKTTDSRFASYIKAYGKSSWELDALPPATLAELLGDHIRINRDTDLWVERSDYVEQQREKLHTLAARL